MSWTALRVHCSGDPTTCDRARLLAVLFDHGATAVQDDDGSLVTYFGADRDVAAATQAIAIADARAHVETVQVPEVDWTEQWKVGVHAHRVGALTVAPPWLAAGLDPVRTIVVDPAMAFGTGEHPSTRGVLRLMQGVVRAGDVVADLGTGSGVLAIAAAKLGARRVAAIEIDPVGIPNAEANVARNGVAERVHVLEGDAGVLLPLLTPVRVVLANILAPVLVELLTTIRTALATDGRAILGGMLLSERDTMVEILTRAGWVVVGDDIESGVGVAGPDGEAPWWSAIIAPS